MKNKIIAIIVTIVFIAGAGTAIGITVDRQHDKETASLVNEAVSKALETTATTTTEATTAATTTTTTKPAATEKATATTEAQTVTDTKNTEKHKLVTSSNTEDIRTTNKATEIKSEDIPEEIYTPVGTVVKIPKDKKQDKYGYYWSTSYTYDSDLNPHSYAYCIDENNQLFYHDDNGNRIYYKE